MAVTYAEARTTAPLAGVPRAGDVVPDAPPPHDGEPSRAPRTEAFARGPATATAMLGGWLGWLGTVVTTAGVAFPVASGVGPLVSPWIPAAGSLPGLLTLGSVLWLAILGWVVATVGADASHVRASRAAAEHGPR